MNKNSLILGASAIGLVGLFLFMRNKDAQKSIEQSDTSKTETDEKTDEKTDSKPNSKGRKGVLSTSKQVRGIIDKYQTITPLGNEKGSNLSTASEDIDFSQPSRRDCRKEAREMGIKPRQIRKTIDYVNRCKREGGFDSGFDGSYNFNTSAFDTDTEQFAFNGHTF
jgi:hypothetical protein